MPAGPGARRVLEFVATFAGAVVLHALWDTFSGVAPFLILAAISLGWLFWALHRYRAFAGHRAGEPSLAA